MKEFLLHQMGISHDNCDCCGEIYADCDDHKSCNTCNFTWCRDCINSDTRFYYNGKQVCDECFPPQGRKVPKRKLLDMLLTETNQTYEEAESRFRKTNSFYAAPEKVEYTCSKGCNPSCKTLEEDFEDPDDGNSGEDIIMTRGLCCAVKFPKKKTKWCSECKKINYFILKNAISPLTTSCTLR